MKFSAIICTYNSAHMLGAALDSVAGQTLRDFELLVVDDGSTDGTEQLVRDFSSRFTSCIYLKKAHTGLADSRNVGIRTARGSHIAFLDADDFWSPDYLSTIQSVLEAQPRAELICTDGWVVDAAGRLCSSAFPADLPPVCGRVDAPAPLFSFFRFATPSGMTLSRRLWETTGPLDRRLTYYGQDWDWVIRAAVSGAFCVRVDRKLFLYRRHRDNLTNQGDKMFGAWLSIVSRTLRPMPRYAEYEDATRSFTRRFLRGVLVRYPGKRVRALIRQAEDAIGPDWVLGVACVATFPVLNGVLRLAAAARRSFLRSGQVRVVDLSAPTGEIFRQLRQ